MQSVNPINMKGKDEWGSNPLPGVAAAISWGPSELGTALCTAQGWQSLKRKKKGNEMFVFLSAQ